MKKSLSTRLMYSFMTIIIIVVVGITAGISYLIADYFFQIKEQELAEKGNEMGETVEAFIRLQDRLAHASGCLMIITSFWRPLITKMYKRPEKMLQ